MLSHTLGCQVFNDPPHSCQQGVCTTCAGLIRSGELGVDYKVAVDALSDTQKAEVRDGSKVLRKRPRPVERIDTLVHASMGDCVQHGTIGTAPEES